MLITGKRLLAKMESTQLDLQHEQVSSAKLLGLDINKELSFKDHVHAYICKKLAKRIGTLRRIKGCLPMRQRLLYYNSVIKPIMIILVSCGRIAERTIWIWFSDCKRGLRGLF